MDAVTSIGKINGRYKEKIIAERKKKRKVKKRSERERGGAHDRERLIKRVNFSLAMDLILASMQHNRWKHELK